MPHAYPAEEHQTIVIGGGQAGLSVGHHLARRGLPFLILEANPRVGDSWRARWDSLRLFTPARFDGLDGMPFPADRTTFPTKDEMADYLESYVRRFDLPVRTATKVTRLTRDGDDFMLETGDRQYRARNVVVAMAGFQKPMVPPFAAELDPAIVQLHSFEYRNPSQLQDGGVLIVGAGNSGSEIARELMGTHPIWLSGRNVGEVPFRIEKRLAQAVMMPFVLRFLFHRLLTVRTPLGRKARPRITSMGGPLIRVKYRDLAAGGVERAPRVVGAKDGQPLLEDGRTLDAANVVWCTGFHPGFTWIDLPIHGEREPRHQSGVVAGQPGLYFVGLHFLHAMSSAMIHGVGRDADRIAGLVAGRAGGRGQRTVAAS